MTAQSTPVQPAPKQAGKGCCTPTEDKRPQKLRIPPSKVLPIIFLPGIMGSNLRLTSRRQKELRKNNNIAWRPDRKGEAADLMNASEVERQMSLDPSTTEVDIYDQRNTNTGNAAETSAARHEVTIGIESPMLFDDPSGTANAKTRHQKATERGWSEVYFSSYQTILEQCELHLNNSDDDVFRDQILGKSPTMWGANPSPPLTPLSRDEYVNAIKGVWFPVHAMGYNWLRPNSESAKTIAKRISSLMQKYKNEGFECEKVILVTHSMGGLLARALVHPAIGKFEQQVLGIVHGVMPAVGAPAAYRRMRCGTEGGGAALVMGAFGNLVTAVLGNAQGGLELLPSKGYGYKWLEIWHNSTLLKSLPENDPYEEIYKLDDAWYRLIRKEWLNPADLPYCSFGHTCDMLDAAKDFHVMINDTYHPVSYAHYGADGARPSWEKVIWKIGKDYRGVVWRSLHIYSDDKRGTLRLYESNQDATEVSSMESTDGSGVFVIASESSFALSLGPSTGPGDQTVPLLSSEKQLLSGKFSGVFRQVGYEHQTSYKNTNAINSTLYSLIRIASQMKWISHETN